MKKLLLMAFLTVGLTANAEDKNENVLLNDANTATFTVNDDVDTNDGGVKIANGKDDDDRWSLHLAVGVDIPTGAPDGVDFAPFRSWEINLTLMQYDYTPKKSKTTLSAGLGFNWRKYTLSGHKDGFFKMGDVVTVGQADAGLDDFSSKIHTTSLAMPLLIKQRFGKNFAISVGAQLNWNFYARIHNYYEEGDHDVDDYTRKIGERPFTVDVLGIVHISKGFGVYCKYSPMSVLKKDRGVDFKSLAVGFYF
jgi:hypothetical protein